VVKHAANRRTPSYFTQLSYLLSSLEAAFRATDDTDGSIAGSDNKLSGRKNSKTRNTLTETVLLRSDQLECVRDHVDRKNISSRCTAVEELVIRRHLYVETHRQYLQQQKGGENVKEYHGP